MNLLIKGGRIIDPSQDMDDTLDLLIESGIVKVIEKHLQRERFFKTGECEIIDADGCIVAPGLIDSHAHLREPGYEYKETIKTGTYAAAAGGFTSLVCMANTVPVNDCSSVTEFILDKARLEGIVNVYPVGAMTKGLKGETLAEIGELKEAGVVALSDDGNPVMNAELVRRGLEYSSMFDLPVISHCESKDLSRNGVMNEGIVSTELGLRGIPSISEEIMVARDIALAEYTGCRLHIAHVSTSGSVRIIRAAKERGVPVTCEVTPHHLILTDEQVKTFDTNTKVNPPLRTKSDVMALRDGLADGTIDILATDHAPHSRAEKEVEYNYADFGITGLETAVPLFLGVVSDGVITLNEMIKKLTINPAQLFGLRKGSLREGRDADVVIINPEMDFIVDREQFRSKGKNTPFNGWKLRGQVIHTIVKGRRVYSRDENESVTGAR